MTPLTPQKQSYRSPVAGRKRPTGSAKDADSLPADGSHEMSAAAWRRGQKAELMRKITVRK